MIKTLRAKGNYPDIEVDFKEVDLVGAENVEAVLAQVTDMKVVTAQKTAVVQARPAVLGEKVETNPRCEIGGYIYILGETEQEIQQKHVDRGDVIVENPDGELYVVNGQKFPKKYDAVEDGYKPVDGPKKFVTVTEDICFKAPWGEMIFSPKGSKLCVEYIDSRDIYSVTNVAFDVTYQGIDIADEDEND